MQETDPVYHSESLGYWILTRYQDVEVALKDERLSSDRSTLFIHQLGDLDIDLIQNFLRLIGSMMLEKDPPVHTQMRKLANQGFTPRALESWRSIIQQTTDRLLDQVQHTEQDGYCVRPFSSFASADYCRNFRSARTRSCQLANLIQ